MTTSDERIGSERLSSDINNDLGFGAVVSRESRRRLLNQDGGFNVRREGLPFLESLNAYHAFLTVSWSKFFSLVVVAYVLANALFAFLYMACGENALGGGTPNIRSHFATAFFF